MEIRARGIRFHAEAEGAGKLTLVFLHYFGGSVQSWQEAAQALRGDYHCLTLDLRGFGDSDAPAEGYEINAQAEDVAAILQARAIKNYALVGHSMGGKIALALAAQRPPGLEALLLLAPSPPIPEPMRETERQNLLATHGERRAALETARKITAQPLPDALRTRVVADNLRSSAPGWRAWLEGGSRENITAQMEGIQVPGLVIMGERDPVMNEALLRREVVARLADCEAAVLPGAGHLLPLEAAQETALAMVGWLKKRQI